MLIATVLSKKRTKKKGEISPTQHNKKAYIDKQQTKKIISR